MQTKTLRTEVKRKMSLLLGLVSIMMYFKGTFEFFLNIFTEFGEFSDKNNIILKILLGLNPSPPV